MNKGLFGFFTIFLVLFVSAIYYSNYILTPILSSLNYIKVTYHDSTQYLEETINKHFFQAQKIATLEENTTCLSVKELLKILRLISVRLLH